MLNRKKKDRNAYCLLTMTKNRIPILFNFRRNKALAATVSKQKLFRNACNRNGSENFIKNKRFYNGALFLDRDGTIIYDRHYLRRLQDIEFLPEVKTSLKLLKSIGYILIIVTNQSGIGRNLFGKDFVEKTHAAINGRLDGIIDDFFYCPHIPDEFCSCRKPKNGMLIKASKKWHIDLKISWIIGDSDKDIKMAENTGIRTIKIGRDSSHYALTNWTKIARLIRNEISCS